MKLNAYFCYGVTSDVGDIKDENKTKHVLVIIQSCGKLGN